MKIGILTFHDTPNFGATLQCYALSRHLRSEGHEVEVVNYTPKAARKAYRKELFGKPRRSWRNIARVFRFNRFVADGLPLSGARIDEVKKLTGLRARYDLLIVGSDEVWKVEPRLRPFDPTFYLDFADPARTRLVSYAASASVQSDMRAQADRVRPLLERFHAISVRDRHTGDMVADLVGVKPTEVLDPTFLWDFRAETTKPIVTGDYLALYGWPDAQQSKALREYARRKGLRLVAVGCLNPAADESFIGIGPAEWMRLIRHARFFVTDYFHGAAFALHFEVPFAIYVNPWKSVKIRGLADKAGVSHRLFADIASFIASPEADAAVDFAAVRAAMRPHLDGSVAFLREQTRAAAAGKRG